MKLSLMQEGLSRALGRVVRVVSSRPQLPVLSNVLMDARKEGLFVSVTDLEIAMTVRVGAKIDEKGKVTVPARMFAEFIGSIPAGSVILELKKETLHVESGAYKAKFQTISSQEFPDIAGVESVQGAGSMSLEQGVFARAMEEVMFAAARDSMRPVLTGVYFEFKSSKLNLVATDGFRLATRNVKPGGDGKSESFIVPARAVSEIAKLEGSEVKFRFLKESNQVMFVVGDDLVLCQVLEGNFPEYGKIIPEDHETEVIFDKEEMLQAVRASLIFARDNSNVLKLEIDKGKVKIVAESPEQGENVVEVMAEVRGEGGEVAFNGKFILDYLQTMRGVKVFFGMGGSLTAGLFRDEKADDYLYVVMPINL